MGCRRKSSARLTAPFNHVLMLCRDKKKSPKSKFNICQTDCSTCCLHTPCIILAPLFEAEINFKKCVFLLNLCTTHCFPHLSCFPLSQNVSSFLQKAKKQNKKKTLESFFCKVCVLKQQHALHHELHPKRLSITV